VDSLLDVTVRAGKSSNTAASLPGLLAQFVKLISLLPPANERVVRSVRSVLEELSRQHEHRLVIDMKLERDRVRIGDETVDADYNPNLRWLLDLLERSGVAALEFRATINSEALFAFGRQAVANVNCRGANFLFSDLWPEEYRGIHLVERRYDGAFPVERGPHSACRTRWKTAGRQGQMLAEILDSDRELHDRLVQLQLLIDQVAERDEPGAPRRKVDVIGRIVNLLPAQASVRPKQLREMADHLLRCLSEEIKAPEVGERDRNVDRMLLRLSRKFFYRGDRGEERGEDAGSVSFDEREDTALGERSRPEDLEVVLAAALPAVRCDRDGPQAGGMDEGSETIGVLLHFLMQLKDEDAAAGVYRSLVPLLEAGPDAGRRVLLRFVELARLRFEQWRQVRYLDRLAFLLGDPRLAGLSREIGLFSLEQMTRFYPAAFLPYLDWIDPERPGELRHLEAVCRAVGAGRLVDSRQELEKAGGFERDRRAEKLLGHPHKGFLPLYHLILRERGARATEVVLALRELGLEGAEAAPLSLLERPEELPPDYLLRLTSPSGSAEDRRELVASAARLLTQVATDENRPVERRVVAISRLGMLGGPSARETLADLAGSRRWLVFPVQAAVIREAARHALDSCRV